MCVVSMIMDHFGDKWQREYDRQFRERQRELIYVPVPNAPARWISPEEIKEFHDLLERAREYDRRHQEPDCELEEKRKRVKDLAKELGVEVEFV